MKNDNDSLNVYTELGVADPGEMLFKAQLALIISEIIKHRKLTQAQASSILALPQPTLSYMLRGNFRSISGTTMLTRLHENCANEAL